MGNAHTKTHPKLRNKKQVHWKAAVRPEAPGKPHLLPNNDGTADLISLQWTPPLNDGGSPIFGYLVEHRRVGSPHWVRATPLPTPYPEITLSGLEPGWRYQFRVSAENAVGYSDHSDISDAITVTLQRSAVAAPQFTQDIVDTVALENNKCEFVVHFLGQPPPKICWYKDGFEIFSSRRIRILTEHDRSILTIHQTSLSDEGEIKCTATNRAGHASTKSRLTVEAPPSIRLPRNYEEGLLFEIGEIIRLKVSVVGRPSPLIFWTHNSETIQNGDRYEIENVDKSTVLRINEAQRSDRGEYLIKAVNKLGEDSTSFLVTVTNKPSPPGKARVVMALGKSVTLTWGVPDDDGGCKIGNYIVEYYRLGWNVWLKAATSRQLSTILGDLIEGSEYKFRIKAESPYGVSDPSEESEVVFIPDHKRGLTHPPLRGRSQPKDFFNEPEMPVVSKRKNKARSQSSSRAEYSDINANHATTEPPVRPKRMKTKSQPQTPEASPMVQRRESQINKSIFDRSSIARDLAYGSPEIKVRKEEMTPRLSQTPRRSVPIEPEPPTEFRADHAVYKVKIEQPIEKKTPNVEPKPVTSPPVKKKLIREHSATVSGSSEFMLVLYSDESEKDQSDIFNFDENSIPPPLSLSAPELSCLEPPQFPPLKSSASSTELLHERALMRFCQEAEAEEKELKRNQINHPDSDIPKIQINSRDSDNIVGLDRGHSLRRKLSGGNLSQQAKWAQKRYSLKNATDIGDLIPNNLKKSPGSIDMNRQDSILEEPENITSKKPYSQDSFERKQVTTEEETKWMEEFEESVSESETDSESDFERFKLEVSRSKKVHLDGHITEEATYRPAGGLSNLKKRTQEPFEILTKPRDPPDPNFKPKPILKKADSPSMSPPVSPPLSPTRTSTRSLSPRPDMVLRRNRSKSLAVPALPPLVSTSSGDESDEPKQRTRSFSLTSNNGFEPKIDASLKKTTTKKSANKTSLPSISAVAQISGITAASIVIPDKLLDKKKDDEAMRIMADHYDSIVRTVGQRRKSNPQLHLDRESMKRVADGLDTPQDDGVSSKEATPSKENLSQDSGYQSVSGYRRSSFTDHYDTFPVVRTPVKRPTPDVSPARKTSIYHIQRSPETVHIDSVSSSSNVIINSFHMEERKERHDSLSEYDAIIASEEIKRRDSISSPSNVSLDDTRRNSVVQNDPKPDHNAKRKSSVSMSTNTGAVKKSDQRRGSDVGHQARRNSQTKSLGVQLGNFNISTHQTKSSGSRSIARSKSPSKRGQSISRGPISVSPAKPPVKPHDEVKKRQDTTSSLSPQPKRAPMLKEIMTQTSGYLESFSHDIIHTGDRLKKELEARAEVQVRSLVDWLTDLAMFAVACWFYLFSNELLAIPVLLVMIYRQLKEEIRKRIPEWVARRFKKKN